ncbi:hypothetical protein EDC02_2249 [Micromonospora sp. Llam0]|uniref:DUF6602 domain-containing protein n=1 Tax=Micromonospora sp. Llam0 TaxID=2485143 RepID=UPI000F47979B|nr:DUF6602 domain-containing protein [Micromonospora sp. Llam0]ROO60386.1 hypothetical protein EDC02_2249 [Micromonospora sp. Llam0]
MDEPGRTHELSTWVTQTTNEMASEYERIRSRALEDPGTAGDQGEENWAQLLKEWLPASYEVRTKGRILAHDGVASRQVDVVVLRPGYPKKLLDKKLYVTSGVAAAFECKLTLSSAHITEATRTAAEIARMAAPRTGSPYRELVGPIVYGILAHSHSWSTAQTAVEKIQEYVHRGEMKNVAHPRENIDLVCVADTCIALKSVEFKKLTNLPGDSPDQLLCLVGNYFACTGSPSIGSLLAYLLIRLGWEDAHVRPFAEYFRLARMLSRSFGGAANLDPTGLTSETEAAARERSDNFLDNRPWRWDEWAFSLE